MMVFVIILLGYIHMKRAKQEPPPDFITQSEEVIIVGEVYKAIESKYSYEIYLKNTSIFYNNESFPCQGTLIYLKTNPNIKIGNIIQVFGTLEEFESPRNEGEFNQFLYYKSKKMNYKMKGQSYKILNEEYSFVLNFLENIKNKVKKVYFQICNEKDYGIFSAIVLGETGELNAEINSLYKENGISHILSISGLHISLIGMGIFKILRKKYHFGISGTVSSILLLAYVALTGFSVSALRAFIMFSISLVAFYMGRTYDMISAISLAAILLLYDNPFLVYNAGFLLSFGAVFGISMIHPILISYSSQKNPILSATIISVSVNLMTLPVLSYYFFETSTYSIILNLLIIPPMAMLMVSGILGGVIGIWSSTLGKISIGLGHYLLAIYEGVCKVFSKFPNNTLLIGRPKLFQIILYYIILSFSLIYMKKKCKVLLVYKKMLRLSFIFLLNIILIVVLSIRWDKRLRITFLDVSQGDGIYMESEEGTRYFIDGGSSDINKLGKYRFIPFLKSNGVKYIDYAILTHADTDHISGLKELLEINSGIQIRTLLLPKIELKDEAYMELEKLALDSGTKLAYMEAGDYIIDGDLKVVCIHPNDSYSANSKNGYSTVLSVSYGEFDMLLTGDLEMDGEDIVLKRIKELGISNYEVLKVAHHGSKNSTSEEFLSKTLPTISIISCGIRNSYGHPHKELIERLESIESGIFLTSQCGGITIKTNGFNIEVERTLTSTLK